VFTQFGFGIVTQSLLILHCYPIDHFLVKGKPYFQRDHDIGLRRFQAYLGLAYSYEISEDSFAKQEKVKKSWKSPDFVRSHLFAHALVTICPNKPAIARPITFRTSLNFGTESQLAVDCGLFPSA
jgi:hypothetical protein